MTDKARLIDLLMDELPDEHPWHGMICKLVDRLIANGVTFAKDTNVPSWIPVSERLPDLTEEENAMIEANILAAAPELNVMIAGATKATTLYYVGDGCWFDGGDTFYPVTHWSSLPEPPKEDSHD